MHPIRNTPIGEGIGGAILDGSPLGKVIIQPDLDDRAAHFGIGEERLDVLPGILEIFPERHCRDVGQIVGILYL